MSFFVRGARGASSAEHEDIGVEGRLLKEVDGKEREKGMGRWARGQGKRGIRGKGKGRGKRMTKEAKAMKAARAKMSTRRLLWQ